MKKVAVQIRLDEEIVQRIDETAKVMGMTRAKYCAHVLTLSHSDDFNPMKVAQGLLEMANKE